MISVIIPAHNEQAVIRRSLESLTCGSQPGEVEIIVVANGCTDATADAARAFAPAVRVIETPIASKIHALNLGDQAASGFPRFFIDADVVLPLDALRRLAARLDAGNTEQTSRSALAVDDSSLIPNPSSVTPRPHSHHRRHPPGDAFLPAVREELIRIPI